MSDPYVGEIRMFGGAFAPRNWAFCTGDLLSVNSNNALFSLLGTTYGGDGRSTFGLPDLRGRAPVHFGTGTGLTPRAVGQRYGSETVTLSVNDIPRHQHLLQASTNVASSSNPGNDVLAAQNDGDLPYGNVPSDTSVMTALSSTVVATSGNNLAHANLMPYQCVSFIICLFGTYPSRA